MDRRRRTAGAVLAGVVALTASLAGTAAAQDATPDRVRVIHLTLDSLHPRQVGPDTPTLQQLRDQGTWYEQARAVMASETLPNHVAMGTGTYPGTNGIPGNNGRAAPGDTALAEPDLGPPEYRQAFSTIQAIEESCPDLRTVGAFSKEYVHLTFSEDGADALFDQPTFNIPGSGHAPDLETVSFLMSEILASAPDHVFANLGDIDRAGHSDATGFTQDLTGQSGAVNAVQRAALQQTDTLLQLLVQQLQQAGLWDSTVLVLSSDHSMDWTNVATDLVEQLTGEGRHVDVAGALEDDARTAGRFLVAENGGAGLVYLLDPAATDRDQVLRDAREVITALDGLGEALYRLPNPLDPGFDLATVHPSWRLEGTDRTGDLFTYAAEDHVVGSVTSNPLPGNHGHVATRHITALITGGWDGVVAQSIAASDPDAIDLRDDTEALPEQLEQVDFAPTFGWLLGIPDPGTTLGGGAPQWEGRVLTEAFNRQPAPICVQAATPAPTPTLTPAPTASPVATPAPVPTPVVAPPAAVLPTTGGGAALLGLTTLGLGGLVARRRR